MKFGLGNNWVVALRESEWDWAIAGGSYAEARGYTRIHLLN